VVLNDLNVERVSVLPLKTDTPLLVDPNAVLPFTVALESLQLIRWRNHEIAEIRSAVQVLQLFGARCWICPSRPFTNSPRNTDRVSWFLKPLITLVH